MGDAMGGTETLWGFLGIVWMVFQFAFPFIVLGLLFAMHSRIEELTKLQAQVANQIAELARTVTPPASPTFEVLPANPTTDLAALLPAEGSPLARLLADPQTRKEALSMRRVYGWSVAVSLVKRKAVELGLGELDVTEDELRAALQSDLPQPPPPSA